LEPDPEASLRRQLNEDAPDIAQWCPTLHPRTVALVRLMLARDPMTRARSADVVVHAISRILDELNAAGKPGTPARPVHPIPARPKAPIAPRRPVTLKRPLPGRSIRRPAPARPQTHTRPPSLPPTKMFDIGTAPPPRPPARPPVRPVVNRPGIRPRRPL
jgi:hypothetical protein